MVIFLNINKFKLQNYTLTKLLLLLRLEPDFEIFTVDVVLNISLDFNPHFGSAKFSLKKKFLFIRYRNIFGNYKIMCFKILQLNTFTLVVS